MLVKRKGNNFEKEISKLLTETTKVPFHRVGVCSGARATTQGLGTGFIGDVFTEYVRFKDIIIECKAYNDLSFNELFSDKSKLFDWIAQCRKESQGKEWVLFIKLNHKGIFVVVQNLVVLERLFGAEFLDLHNNMILVKDTSSIYTILKLR